jgi:predicted enzyme related to lactoylglutathione lyase
MFPECHFDMSLQDLAYTILYVDDMDRATRFYRDRVGLPLAFAAPGWVQFNTNGAAIVLHPRLSEQKNAAHGDQTTHIAFRVDDLDAEYRRLVQEQVEFVAPPASAGFGKHATFLDPEGNAIDLLEWKRAPETPVTSETIVNSIISRHPDTMQVFENHGIRICGGCLVLLNAPVSDTAEYSGLDARESTELVRELNAKLSELGSEHR